jgi:oligopeptide transport system permease protein
MTDLLRPSAKLPPVRDNRIATLRPPRDTQAAFRSTWYDAWLRFQRNTLAVFGLFLILCYLGITLGVDALAPYHFARFDFNQVSAEPTYEHFLGTDSLGRDMLSMLMYGSRVSLAVGLIVPAMVLMIALPIGITSGYAGGRVDALLMRFTDAVMSLPTTLVTMILVITFGRTLWTVIFALGILNWPQLARIVRIETMRLRSTEFVLGARAIGASRLQIVLDHILPNLMGAIVVTTAILIPTMIVEEATLTFLNIGVELTAVPSWAQMIRAEYQGMFSRPTIVMMPALAISFLTLAFSFVGDGLRDALDPRLTRR